MPGASLTLTGAELTEGTRLPWRFVPEGVSEAWVRLRFAFTFASGQKPAKGALFAALMREEDFPYVARQQVR